MGDFTSLSNAEIERRREMSVDAWDALQRARWDASYQERCDSFYWKHGRCCAGCDHWASSEGDIGECTSAPPVSGEQVLKSLGISWCTYTPPPGQPFTQHDHVCGAFRDDFDWSTLDEVYLRRIGARLKGEVQ